MSDIKIALVYGGTSSEREISIKSGEAVKEALERLKANFKVFDPIDRENFIKGILKYKPDVAFNLLHGKGGEDGKIQGFFETAGIPYTGSPVKASAVAMDKALTKLIAREGGVQTPNWTVVQSVRETVKWETFPAVVKPNEEGSSIGVSIVNNREELEEAVKQALKLDKKVLIEEFIQGRELTVGIVGDLLLEPIEIKVEEGFYDYKNKYFSNKTKYIVSPPLPQQVRERLFFYALTVYNSLGCKGVARVDFILKDKTPYFLEINTIPGMTDHSLVPKAAKFMGIDFDQLVVKIIKGALDEKQ
ncbi:MAG: D-alanine--D-alanine ligase [Aquificae bacterium]|nr:D-alanine--D-alanine ligase [Aquificota bacterium]